MTKTKRAAVTENAVNALTNLLGRAESLESLIPHYDHAEGAKIAADAKELRDQAQAIIDRDIPKKFRATWTTENRRQP